MEVPASDHRLVALAVMETYVRYARVLQHSPHCLPGVLQTFLGPKGIGHPDKASPQASSATAHANTAGSSRCVSRPTASSASLPCFKRCQWCICCRKDVHAIISSSSRSCRCKHSIPQRNSVKSVGSVYAGGGDASVLPVQPPGEDPAAEHAPAAERRPD